MFISQDQTDASLELVGGKGQGLLGLRALKARSLEDKVLWPFNDCQDYTVEVPDFIIIPPTVELDSATQEILARAEKIGSVYAVRSSSALEDVGEHSFDGIFDSVLDVTPHGLIAAIEQVRRSATAEKAQRYSAEVGVPLDGRMPVIVQRMVTERTATGVAYSKFPSAQDIAKVMITYMSGQFTMSILRRVSRKDGSVYLNLLNPVLQLDSPSFLVLERLLSIAITTEHQLSGHRIIEFALGESLYGCYRKRIFLLQARRLTKTEYEQRQEPQQEGLLLGSSYNVNGQGEYTGIVFVVSCSPVEPYIPKKPLQEFDTLHPKGYVLVTPYIECNGWNLLSSCPHAKAIVSYTNVSAHHDMEIGRKKDILIINRTLPVDAVTCRIIDIQTGDTVRVTSDGIIGSIYNLSRT